MDVVLTTLFTRFSRYGILHREAIKNSPSALRKLLRKGLARKTYNQGRVFYELTEKAVPLLEQRRKLLLEELRLQAIFEPRLAALFEDMRFLDEQSEVAGQLLFLGDWQLTRSVVPAQLELAKLRFYRERVQPRLRRKATA